MTKREELENQHFDLIIEVAYIARQLNGLKKEVVALEKENKIKMEELDRLDMEIDMFESKEGNRIN